MKERNILFSGEMPLAALEGWKTQTRRIIKSRESGHVLGVNPHTTHIVPVNVDERFAGATSRERDKLRGLMWESGGPVALDRPDSKLAHYQYFKCPYGQPGDRLCVREDVWLFCEKRPNGKTALGNPKFHYVPVLNGPVIYCADRPSKPVTYIDHHETGNVWGWRKKLGRFMPKFASRSTLEIISVRAERLNDISEEDAWAEGCRRGRPTDNGGWFPAEEPHPKGGYSGWDSARDWYANLWELINGHGSWYENPWVWVITFKRITQP